MASSKPCRIQIIPWTMMQTTYQNGQQQAMQNPNYPMGMIAIPSVAPAGMKYASEQVNVNSDFSELFRARHLGSEFQFSPNSKPEKPKYFDEQGAPHPEVASAAGKVYIGMILPEELQSMSDEVIAKTQIKVQNVVDDVEARNARVSKFQDMASSRIQPFTSAYVADFSTMVGEKERLVAVLKCSEITGHPATTYNNSILRGDIAVALVMHETDGCRLIFSLGTAIKQFLARERWFEDKAGCCCFNLLSEAALEYRNAAYFSNQFFSIPISATLIDAIAFRSSVNEFDATTKKLWTQERANVPPQSGDCCVCCRVPCLLCCQCCANTNTSKTINFLLEETFSTGKSQSKVKPIINEKTASVGGIEFFVQGFNEDNIYVHIHYISLFTNKPRTCKLRLKKSDDMARDYDTACLFVSFMGQERNKFMSTHKDGHTMFIPPVDAHRRYKIHEVAAGSVASLTPGLNF